MSKESKRVFPNSTANVFHEDGDVKIVAATSEHAAFLQHRLRDSDVRECLIHGSTPWRALHAPLRNPENLTWTGLYKDEPVCMFGVSPIVMHEEIAGGNIWMLGTHTIEEIPMTFLKMAKNIVEYIMTIYDYVENVVPIDHIETLKWLDWLGFSFAEEATVVNGYSCVRFVRCIETIEVRFQ